MAAPAIAIADWCCRRQNSRAPFFFKSGCGDLAKTEDGILECCYVRCVIERTPPRRLTCVLALAELALRK